MAALKKYVEDTCEAIKQVDNELKGNGSSLETLLFEIPGESDNQVSWRNLIGRRDVIAHRLLTVDDERVYREAERDFCLLVELISRVYFVPIKPGFPISLWYRTARTHRRALISGVPTQGTPPRRVTPCG